MRYKLIIAGKTDTGKKRAKNEDFFTVDTDLGLMVLADGMGGHASGEVASQLATNICADQVKRSLQTGHVPVFKHVPDNPEFNKKSLLLGDCVKFCNHAVHEASQSSEANRNMGTTIVAALWLDDKMAVAHVGDSRLYVVKSGELIQCTTDHSFVQEQVDRGLLKPEDAEKSDLRNMLTRSVGVNEEVDVDVTEVALQPDDFILICSDGLTKMIDDDQIVTSFEPNRSPQEISDELIERANSAGGRDNVTVIVAKVAGTPSLTDRVKGIFKKKAGE